MKDDHQNDHLEAAVQTPDGTFYKVIPSKFLWTSLPPPPGRYNLILLYFTCLENGKIRAAILRDKNLKN